MTKSANHWYQLYHPTISQNFVKSISGSMSIVKSEKLQKLFWPEKSNMAEADVRYKDKAKFTSLLRWR